MSETKKFGIDGLKEKIKENKILICAHRGTCGANIIQNTVEAAKNSMLHEADIFEVDATMSSDGVLFGFHDGHETDVLHSDKRLQDMTAKEIEELPVYNSLMLKTKSRLQRIDYILEELKGVCFINIDRAWFYGDAIIKLIEKSSVVEQIILKSPVDDAFLSLLEKSTANIMYMPIIRNAQEFEKVLKYNLNLVAVELIFDSLDNDMVSKEFLADLKKQNILTWINMITLGDDPICNLSAYLDDDRLILDGPEKSLHVVQDMGFEIVQTDWPYIVKKNIK